MSLLEKLTGAGLLVDDQIILAFNEDGTPQQAVPVEIFQTFFGNSQTYDELIGSHTFDWFGETMTKTGVELGYKPYFDAWKEAGIL